MAQLITNFEGLQGLKRALFRLSNVMQTSYDDQSEILHKIKVLLHGGSSLNQLLKLSSKYDNLLDSMKCCTYKKSAHCDNCNNFSVRGPCDRDDGPFASDLFNIMESVNNSQNLLLSLNHDLCELTHAIVKFYCKCDNRLPCEDELECLIKNLVCCGKEPSCDDCGEFNSAYPVAFVIFVALVFGGQFERVVCLICDKHEKKNDCENCNNSRHHSHASDKSHEKSHHDKSHDDFDSRSTTSIGSFSSSDKSDKSDNKKCCCEKCDKCSPKCSRSLYHLSLTGLQLLMSFNTQDHVNKFFTIIGLTIGGIAQNL
jgi:hypothetical protein